MSLRSRAHRAIGTTAAAVVVAALVTGCGSDAVGTRPPSTRITIQPSPDAAGRPPELTASGRLSIIARNLVAYRSNNGQWPYLNSNAFYTLVNDQILHGGVVDYVVAGRSMAICFAKTDDSWATYRSTVHRITATGASGGCPKKL